MKITEISIYKFSIPMHPFTIATGTMDYAQNVFIRVHTDAGYYGVGECSAFPMIVGETQATCFEMAKEFATLWKNKDPLAIEERLHELNLFTAYNSTIKSAFDMALYDIAAKHASLPLYKFLGGITRAIETDLTIGIDSPAAMAKTAASYRTQSVRIIKIKLGKNADDDIERVKQIRFATGDDMQLRIDANQGWNFDTALHILTQIAPYHIQFCEQPMRRWMDDRLPELKRLSPVKIMADESVFDHHDAERLLKANACDFVNIKFSKSGGLMEAARIDEVCTQYRIACMMGGMLESRVALSAAAHFVMAHPNIQFYDMDTCLLGHKVDPVKGGLQYNGFSPVITDEIGIGADVDDAFLQELVQVTI